ncbi:MAG: hypothetical protein KJ062_01140 [Thermoanaerobaculia bacterium]|nr:hypothetical protein [Thermoanaerobaculia bacterium]
MKNLFQGTASVWKREEGATVLFAFLVVTLFVVPFLRAWFPVLAPASSVALVLLFIVGVLVVFPSAWAKLVACLFAGSAISLEIARLVGGGDPFGPWRVGASCVTIGLFAVVTLFRVFAPGAITTHRLVGAVAAYLLVGLTFALAYEWLEFVRPGSFQAGDRPTEGAYPTILYFSFVTLSTVGYGDVLPLSQQARALSNLESLVGVLYPAVLIGRLLAMHGSGGAPPAGEEPGAP